MLRTTNKVVIRRLEAHVLDNFWPKNYGGGTVGLQNLKDQLDAMQYGDRSIYQTAIDYAEGGSYLIYYGDCRQFLQKTLEQTPEEASRFSDDKVWKLYCHLVARTMAQLYTYRQKELERLGRA